MHLSHHKCCRWKAPNGFNEEYDIYEQMCFTNSPSSLVHTVRHNKFGIDQKECSKLVGTPCKCRCHTSKENGSSSSFFLCNYKIIAHLLGRSNRQTSEILSPSMATRCILFLLTYIFDWKLIINVAYKCVFILLHFFEWGLEEKKESNECIFKGYKV